MIIHSQWYGFVSDDSFITLRYAKNIANGHGIVYNIGERVEGCTSLLWTFFTALFAIVTDNLLPVSRLFGLLAGIAIILISVMLLSSLSQKPPSLIALAGVAFSLACNGSFACWAPSGMETSLFSLLIISTILCYIRKQWILCLVLTICAIWTRPEGIIIGFILIAWTTAEGIRSHDLKTVSLLAIPILVGAAALFLFRYLYFGDWLPNTYYAKTGGGIHQVLRGVSYFSSYAVDHEGYLAMILPVLYFCIRGDAQQRLVATSAALLWLAVIWEGGDGLPMYRFAIPALPLLAVLQAKSIDICVNKLRFFAPRTIYILAGSAIVLWCITSATIPIAGPFFRLYKIQKELQVPNWTIAGRWFKEHTLHEESIAAVPIGAIGYYSGLKIFDMMGLTDRHIAHRKMRNIGTGMAGHEKHDGQYILSCKPTFILAGNIDITSKPRDSMNRPFIPYAEPLIWEWERDLYDSDLIFKLYKPLSVEIAPSVFLNMYVLRQEYR